ncbi:MAG: VTT domain-containing protein [Syntrophomonas sp.]
MKKIPPSIFVNIVLLTLFISIVTYVSFAYAPLVTQLVSHPEEFRDFIYNYGSNGVLIFLIIQSLQVIIAAIPGELVQVAGGFIYGIWWGTLYSLAGIMAGSIVVFYIARLIGYPILKTFIGPGYIERFEFFINSPRAEIVAFILFLIPGIPKDILTYLAGVTPLQPLKFLIIATAARLPGIFMSSFIGASWGANHYGQVAAGSIIALLLFLLGFYNKDKIINKLRKSPL